jgi:hypothetical protein
MERGGRGGSTNSGSHRARLRSFSWTAPIGMQCGVEMWRGGVGAAYLLPALSLAGASLAGGPAGGRGKTGKERQSHNLLLLFNVMASSLEASPCFRFHIPLIEPDVRISRFRLSEKGSRCRPREIARPLAKPRLGRRAHLHGFLRLHGIRTSIRNACRTTHRRERRNPGSSKNL